MTAGPRVLLLPAFALALVTGVLGIQLAYGGGTFEPLRPADPCAVRGVSAQASGIEGLSERLVLLGLDGAACGLHVTREALVLELAQPGPRSPAQVAALRAGLLEAVQKLKDADALPPTSALVDEALDSSDLNGFVKAAIRAVPDSAINSALPTDDVLTRTIDNLDLRTLLANLDDQQSLNRQLTAAVSHALEDSLTARLHDLF
jgi:hypothetical protein